MTTVKPQAGRELDVGTLSRMALNLLGEIDASDRLWRRNASSGYTYPARGMAKLMREGWVEKHGNRYTLTAAGHNAYTAAAQPREPREEA